MNTTEEGKWNLIGLDTRAAQDIATALADGWEPFSVHAEPEVNKLDVRQVYFKTVIWMKKQGAIDPNLKKKPTLSSVS